MSFAGLVVSSVDRWLVTARLPGARRVAVVCFPHAGGGPATYLGLRSELPAWVQLSAIQLPGRERRASEPLAGGPGGLAAVADRLAQTVGEMQEGLSRAQLPLVLFGHSLGALLAFEVAQRLVAGGRAPAALLLSACAAPHWMTGLKPGDLAGAAWLDTMARLGGTPDEVLRAPALLRRAERVFAADLRLLEGYRPGATVPLPIPLTVFSGAADTIAPQKLQAWSRYTSLGVQQRQFRGGHFYWLEERALFVAELVQALRFAALEHQQVATGAVCAR